MSFFRTAAGYRTFYQDISSNLVVTAATSTTTLVTARSTTNHTIYIQRIVMFILTDPGALKIDFQDTAGTPFVVAEIPANPGNDTRWDFDFGEQGIPLTQGKNFQFVPAGTGFVGHIEYYGYSKLTAAMAAGTGN